MLTLYKYKTAKNADSIEFCPHAPHQNLFVCANYQLDNTREENSLSTRTGFLLLFSITKENGLKLLQSLECIGVLDSKWYRNKINSRSVLGVANAENTIEIYELTSEVRLRLVTKLTVNSDYSEVLILSLDWSSESPEIICSDSKGYVHKLTFKDDQLSYINGYKAHDYESWIAAYNYFDTNVFYSGGDDCKFLAYDSRMGNLPVFQNKTHEAGVTSIHSSLKYKHLIATGSYDTYLRLWDSRNLKGCLSRLELPGTLWRLKWDPFGRDYLLAACMLGGAHVVEVKNNKSEIIRSCKEHENLVYGIDWCYLSGDEIERFNDEARYLIGSCSFYDNLLCLSTFR